MYRYKGLLITLGLVCLLFFGGFLVSHASYVEDGTKIIRAYEGVCVSGSELISFGTTTNTFYTTIGNLGSGQDCAYGLFYDIDTSSVSSVEVTIDGEAIINGSQTTDSCFFEYGTWNGSFTKSGDYKIVSWTTGMGAQTISTTTRTYTLSGGTDWAFVLRSQDSSSVDCGFTISSIKYDGVEVLYVVPPPPLWTQQELSRYIVATTTVENVMGYMTVDFSGLIGSNYSQKQPVADLGTYNFYSLSSCGGGGGTGTWTATSTFTLTLSTMSGDCEDAGTYYYVWRDTSASSTILYTASFEYTGTGVVPVDPPAELTRIIINTPPPDTASTTFSIDFDYFLNDEDSEYTHILFQLCAQSYPNDDCENFSYTPTVTNVLTNDTIEVTTNREGYYLLLANFWNGIELSVVCDWWNPLCEDEISNVGTGDSSTFNVATSSIQADVPDWILTSDFCGEFEGIIDSALCNGIAFLFMPSPNTLRKIDELQVLIMSKQPWGFFLLINNELNGIVETSTSTIGTDLTINLPILGGTTTVFSWTDAKEQMTETGFYNEDTTNILVTFVWFMILLWFWGLFFRPSGDPHTLTIGNSR